MNKTNPNSFLKNFTSVRKLIAILVTLVFCYLSIVGDIRSSEFIPVFSMIVGYYFGKSTALDLPSGNKGDKQAQESQQPQ